MSHIFDALQRSEADRVGTDVKALPGATELLERAERHASDQWSEESLEDLRPLVDGVAAEAAEGGAAAELRAAVRTVATEPLPKFQELEVAAAAQSRLVCLAEQQGPAAEAFRLLAVRLRDIRRQRALNSILITSSVPEEGKSLVAANLACALSAGKQRVVLLEGDLRRPSLGEKFGLARTAGVCEYLLQGDAPLADYVYRLERAGCWIMPAGTPSPNPLEMMQSKRLPAIVEQLKRWFDWVIVDSPPVMPLADTSIWARLVDGILLVTRPGVTEKKKLQKGLEAIDTRKLIGGIMNSSRIPSEMDYYYHYGSHSSDKPQTPAAD